MSSYLSPSAWNSFLRKLEAATEVEEQNISNTLFLTFGSRIQVGQKLVEIQQQLGAGAFGVVYKVKDVATLSEYALKVVVCTNESDILDVDNEILTLRKISHQNIISIIESGDYEDTEGSWHMLILTEYCSGGNLNDRLTRASSENVSEEVGEELERKWILQMAEAFQFLHSINLVHRDLKPENVLLSANDDIKIGDFGLAREFISVKQTGTVQGTVSTYLTYKRYYMNTFVGTPHWMAPEVFPGPQGHGHYNEKADVFSLGILFLAILEREFIIDHEGKRYYGAFVDVDGEGKVGIGYAMYKFGSRVVADSLQPRGSNSLWMIALDALKFEPKDRPSAVEICDRITSFVVQSQFCPPITSGVYPSVYQPPHPASSFVNQPPHPASSFMNQPPHPASSFMNQPPQQASSLMNQLPHPASSFMNQPPHPASSFMNQPLHPVLSFMNQPPHPASNFMNQPPHPASNFMNQPPQQASSFMNQPPHPN